MVQVSFVPPLSSPRPRETLEPGALAPACTSLIFLEDIILQQHSFERLDIIDT